MLRSSKLPMLNLHESSMASAEQIATAVAQKLPDNWIGRSPLRTTEEAMRYCRIESDRTWRRFCKRTGLEAVSKGRYDQQAVERAAQRDVRISRK